MLHDLQECADQVESLIARAKAQPTEAEKIKAVVDSETTLYDAIKRLARNLRDGAVDDERWPLVDEPDRETPDAMAFRKAHPQSFAGRERKNMELGFARLLRDAGAPACGTLREAFVKLIDALGSPSDEPMPEQVVCVRAAAWELGLRVLLLQAEAHPGNAQAIRDVGTRIERLRRLQDAFAVALAAYAVVLAILPLVDPEIAREIGALPGAVAALIATGASLISASITTYAVAYKRCGNIDARSKGATRTASGQASSNLAPSSDASCRRIRVRGHR